MSGVFLVKSGRVLQPVFRHIQGETFRVPNDILTPAARLLVEPLAACGRGERDKFE